MDTELKYPTYLNEDMLPYPYCPGCGHGVILDHLNEALVQLQLDPRKVVIVTDIGCVGLSDRYFETNAFHGLHGRALTYATGIKLVQPDLKVIVLVGDGGCGIGGAHLINAARRNIGLTVLVFNNLNYGMTGGEHSATTPPQALTTTTRYGNLERPMDVCSTVAVNGASFVARKTSFEKDLTDLIAQAIQTEGFSLIDIWELCVAYYVPNNRFSRSLLEQTMDELGFDRGILQQRDYEEYSRAYRRAAAGDEKKITALGQLMDVRYGHNLRQPLDVTIAGSAGMRIGSAAGALSRGAVISGLWAAQRDDYPVTVRSGFSVSEVALDPQKEWDGADRRQVFVVLFPEGLKKVRAQLARLSETDRVYVNAHLLPVETKAQVIPLDFSSVRRKEQWSMVAVAEILRDMGIYPLQAYRDAIALQPQYAEANLAAIEAGLGKVILDGR